MGIRVDIGIAASHMQYPEWWVPVFSRLLREQQRGIELGQILGIASALPDSNKNQILQHKLPDFDQELYESKRRASLTDANRVEITNGFLSGDSDGNKADWIFWMDDDTIPPDGVISKLLRAKKDFIAGLYFLAREPYNPIAYIKESEDTWGYRAIYDFPMGSLFTVDSVGMGCTLIHRRVYEKIMEEHELYRRPDGTLIPVHKSKIYNTGQGETVGDMYPKSMQVVDGYLIQKLEKPAPEDNRTWPFYAMEFIRTEDHYFCELAGAVGYKPWIDSTILCEHIKPHHVDYEYYKTHVELLKDMKVRDAQDEDSGI